MIRFIPKTKSASKYMPRLFCAATAVFCAALVFMSAKGSGEDGSSKDGIQVLDSSGFSEPRTLKKDGELRGTWISFLNFKTNGYTRASFTKQTGKMMDTCVKNNLNAVFFHVRMFSDAMYNSEYYPWSKYCSGKIGKSPGFDPLAIAIDEAHKRGLEIHAWINPYRITKDSTSASALAKDSYAYRWKTSKSKKLRRNVLSYGNQLYFNPSRPAVRRLIVNGAKEIVKNYDVDGIHFDDYFYPNLGASYRKNFDAPEYRAYRKRCEKNNEHPSGIAAWRRGNVSKLVSQVYSSVKKIDDGCAFGISPAGNMKNLYLKTAYYCDVKKWMNRKGYVDYICPQIYWSFENAALPYKKALNRWTDAPRRSGVKLFVGLAAYRAGISAKEARSIRDTGWAKSSTVLKREIAYARKAGAGGFVFFDYSDLNRQSARKEIKNAASLFKSA